MLRVWAISSEEHSAASLSYSDAAKPVERTHDRCWYLCSAAFEEKLEAYSWDRRFGHPRLY